MPRPNVRVEKAYLAYVAYHRDHPGNGGGKKEISREAFLKNVMDGFTRYFGNGAKLYIVDWSRGVQELNLDMDQAAEKDKELDEQMQKELSPEEYADWKKQGGVYTHRTEQMEKLYALDDQGFHFIREGGSGQYKFVHFHTAEREKPDSYAKAEEIGTSWDMPKIPDENHLLQREFDGELLIKGKNIIKTFTPGNLPEHDLGGFAFPFFGAELVARNPKPDLDNYFKKEFPLESVWGKDEQSRVRERATRVGAGFKSYKGVYLADNSLTKCQKLEIDFTQYEDEFDKWAKSGYDPKYYASNKEKILAGMDKRESQLQQFQDLKKQGYRFLKLYPEGNPKVVLSSVDYPFAIGVQKNPDMPEEVEKPEKLPWYKRYFYKLKEEWRKEMDDWNKRNKEYEKYLALKKEWDDEVKRFEDDVKKVEPLIKNTEYKFRQEKQLYESSKVKEPEKFVKALSELSLCGYGKEQLGGVVNPLFTVLAEKTVEGGWEAKEQAVECLRELEGGKLKQTMDLLVESLAFYNLCFKRSKLPEQGAADSSAKIRAGLVMMGKLREEYPEAYEEWKQQLKPGAGEKIERIVKECKGAITLADYAEGRKNGLDKLLNTDASSMEREEWLKNLLVPFMISSKMRRHYMDERREAMNQQIAITRSWGTWYCKADKKQTELGEEYPETGKMDSLHKGWGDTVARTDTFKRLLDMSKEALRANLVGVDGKLQEKYVGSVVEDIVNLNNVPKKGPAQAEVVKAQVNEKHEQKDAPALMQ